MKYFGETWGSNLNDTVERAATPVGFPCASCGEGVDVDDRGLLLPYIGPNKDDREVVWVATSMGEVQHLPYHLDCLIEAILPGLESPSRKP